MDKVNREDRQKRIALISGKIVKRAINLARDAHYLEELMNLEGELLTKEEEHERSA